MSTLRAPFMQRKKNFTKLQTIAMQPKPLSLSETIQNFSNDMDDHVKEALLLKSYSQRERKWWRKGNGITGVDTEGRTPLIYAVLKNDLYTIKWLCKKQKARYFFHQNPKPNHLDRHGKSALMYAIQLGYTEIVEELIKITNVNNQKYLPLWYAVQEEKATIPLIKAIAHQTKRVASNGLLFALVRSKHQATQLTELTDFVFGEIAKSLKTEGAVDVRNYKRICLRVLQAALREQKFDVIEHLFSTTIQKAFNINQSAINATWDSLLNYVIGTHEWADKKSLAVQEKAKQGIYEFVKYFLKLAAKQGNSVFLRNKNWDGICKKLHVCALQKKDMEMQQLLFPIKLAPIPLPQATPSFVVPQIEEMAAVMRTQYGLQPQSATAAAYLACNGEIRKSVAIPAAFYSPPLYEPPKFLNPSPVSFTLNA